MKSNEIHFKWNIKRGGCIRKEKFICTIFAHITFLQGFPWILCSCHFHALLFAFIVLIIFLHEFNDLINNIWFFLFAKFFSYVHHNFICTHEHITRGIPEGHFIYVSCYPSWNGIWWNKCGVRLSWDEVWNKNVNNCWDITKGVRFARC